MGRPKTIDDNVLLDLIKKLYYFELHENASLLTTKLIVQYVQANGYPDYQSYTLRRTPRAMKLIKELKSSVNDSDYQIISSYQTIDAEKFVSTHTTNKSLIQAIVKLDTHYRDIAESAARISNRFNELQKKYNDIFEEKRTLEDITRQLEVELNVLKQTLRSAEDSKDKYKRVLDLYVYPNVARKILVSEHLIEESESIICETILESEIINETSVIESDVSLETRSLSGSSVIMDLYDF